MTKIGRPATKPNPLDPGIADAIADRLIAGESIRSICADPSMPGLEKVYQTMARDEDFRNAIARARELQQEAIIDSTVDIADCATPEDVNVAKLRIWARQWRAAKLAPKKYGEKVTQEISGADGGPVRIERVIIDPAAQN